MLKVRRDRGFSAVLSNDLADEKVLEEGSAFDDVQKFCELSDKEVLGVGHVVGSELDERGPCRKGLVFPNVSQRHDVGIAIPGDDGASFTKVEKVARSSPSFLIFLVGCPVEFYLFANFDLFEVELLRSSVVGHSDAFFHDGAKDVLFGFNPHPEVGLEVVWKDLKRSFEGRGRVGVS